MANPLVAAKAYAAASQAFAGAGAGASLAGSAAGAARPDFAAMVSNVLQSTSQAGARADSQAVAALGGKADIVDVVTAVAESEAAIETLVAVRDRVIAAYEDIMRMPI